ncbi:MAG TPA: ABC transporter ATP-binding protein [Acidimicrobiales bacterium]|nr:ABC transporter ATP-binding protein [Acidimicrobiales bacterium]
MGQRDRVSPSVVVRDLSHRYPSPGGELTVLDDVSFEVDAGGYVALTGPSGAGKTTLLSLLGGLDSVQSGLVEVEGTDLSDVSGSDLARFRCHTVGFVFQHFGLLQTLTAAENVELALALSGASPKVRRSVARDLLDAVGLGARLDHRPHQLSGGERQRVAIARALANQPRLVLADEPTGNLDEDSADNVITLLESLPGSRGVTLIVVTHNHALAARAATRLALDRGRLVTAVDRT